jgi:hypothetical protein
VVLFIIAVLVPLDHSVTSAQQRLAKKRADLAWMQGVAPELATAPAPPSDSGESLLVIIDRSARESARVRRPAIHLVGLSGDRNPQHQCAAPCNARRPKCVHHASRYARAA